MKPLKNALCAFLILGLVLPPPAYGLRTQAPKETGMEEGLRASLTPSPAGAEETAKEQVKKLLPTLALGTEAMQKEAEEKIRQIGPEALEPLLHALHVMPTKTQTHINSGRGAALGLLALNPRLSDEQRRRVISNLEQLLHSKRIRLILQIDPRMEGNPHTWLKWVIPAAVHALRTIDPQAADRTLQHLQREISHERGLASTVIRDSLRGELVHGKSDIPLNQLELLLDKYGPWSFDLFEYLDSSRHKKHPLGKGSRFPSGNPWSGREALETAALEHAREANGARFDVNLLRWREGIPHDRLHAEINVHVPRHAGAEEEVRSEVLFKEWGLSAHQTAERLRKFDRNYKLDVLKFYSDRDDLDPSAAHVRSDSPSTPNPPPGYDFGDLFLNSVEAHLGQEAEGEPYYLMIERAHFARGPPQIRAEVVAGLSAGAEENRQEILSYLRNHPGGVLTLQAISTGTGLAPRTVQDHNYRQLIAQVNRRRPKDSKLETLRPGQRPAAMTTEGKISDFLRRHPGGRVTLGEISQGTGLSAGTISDHDYRSLVEKENANRPPDKQLTTLRSGQNTVSKQADRKRTALPKPLDELAAEMERRLQQGEAVSMAEVQKLLKKYFREIFRTAGQAAFNNFFEAAVKTAAGNSSVLWSLVFPVLREAEVLPKSAVASFFAGHSRLLSEHSTRDNPAAGAEEIAAKPIPSDYDPQRLAENLLQRVAQEYRQNPTPLPSYLQEGGRLHLTHYYVAGLGISYPSTTTLNRNVPLVEAVNQAIQRAFVSPRDLSVSVREAVRTLRSHGIQEVALVKGPSHTIRNPQFSPKALAAQLVEAVAQDLYRWPKPDEAKPLIISRRLAGILVQSRSAGDYLGRRPRLASLVNGRVLEILKDPANSAAQKIKRHGFSAVKVELYGGLNAGRSPYNMPKTARKILFQIAQQLPNRPELLKKVDGRQINLGYRFTSKLDPSFPSRMSFIKSNSLVARLNHALDRLIQNPSDDFARADLMILNRHGIDRIQIAPEKPLDPRTEHQRLAREILLALPDAIRQDPFLRKELDKSPVLALSFHTAGRKVLQKPKVTDHFGNRKGLVSRTNLALAELLEQNDADAAENGQPDPLREAVLRLQGLNVRQVIIQKGEFRGAAGAEEREIRAVESLPVIQKLLEETRLRIAASGEQRPAYIVLDGDKGAGKSTLASYFARALGIPMIPMDLYVNHDAEAKDWSLLKEAVRKETAESHPTWLLIEGYKILDAEGKLGIPFDVKMKLVADDRTRRLNIEQRIKRQRAFYTDTDINREMLVRAEYRTPIKYNLIIENSLGNRLSLPVSAAGAGEIVLEEFAGIPYDEVVRQLKDRPIDSLEIRRDGTPHLDQLPLSWHIRGPAYPPPDQDFSDLFESSAVFHFGDTRAQRTYSLRFTEREDGASFSIHAYVTANTKNPTAGAEETKKAAELLRPLFNFDAAQSDSAVVHSFLELLRQKPEGVVDLSQPAGAGLLSVTPYRAGAFARNALGDGREAEEHLNDDWIPSLDKVLEGIAGQLKPVYPNLTPKDLGAETLRELLKALFFARDERGDFLMGRDDETYFYRWIYREIPRLLIPRLAAPWILRDDSLTRSVENPFRITNDEGNDAVRQTIAQLAADPASGFIDDPARLQADPALLKPWLLFMLAANLVDYSRPAILKEIEQEGDLARYILKKMGTPFPPGMNPEPYLQRFFSRLSQPQALLAHLADNNAELAASLKLDEALLSAYPGLTIALIIKGDNGAMNDGSLEDAERLLAQPPEGTSDPYARLKEYRAQDRFRLVAGPLQHAMPLDRLPPAAAEALQKSTVALSEGEANLSSLNGLSKEIYFALRLKWSFLAENIVGLDLPAALADQHPPVFFGLDGSKGRYYQNPYDVDADEGAYWTIVQTLAEQAAAGTGSPVRLNSFSLGAPLEKILREKASNPALAVPAPQIEVAVDVLHEFLEDLLKYSHGRNPDFRITVQIRREGDLLVATLEDESAQYQREIEQKESFEPYFYKPRIEAEPDYQDIIRQSEGGTRGGWGIPKLHGYFEEGKFLVAKEEVVENAGVRYTLHFPLPASAPPAAGLEEFWKPRLTQAAQAWEGAGWLPSADAFLAKFLRLGRAIERHLARAPSRNLRFYQEWGQRQASMEIFALLMDGLVQPREETPLRMRYLKIRRNQIGAHLEFPSRDGISRVYLHLRADPKAPLFSTNSSERGVSPESPFRGRSFIRFGVDRSWSNGVPLFHLDWDGQAPVAKHPIPWRKHIDFSAAWSGAGRRPEEARKRLYQAITEKILPALREIPEKARASGRVEFLRLNPQEISRVPDRATFILTAPLGTPVTLYRPESLSVWLSRLVEKQKGSLPENLQIRERPVPDSPGKFSLPGVLIQDRWLAPPAYQPPVPVIQHGLADTDPFPYDLVQLIAMAVLGTERATGYRVLSAWTYVREGREYLAIAVAA